MDGGFLNDVAVSNIYGRITEDVLAIPAKSRQFSPLVPGSVSLDEQEPASLDTITVLAPAATVERRAVLALALRALRPGAPYTMLAPKDKGGSRLGADLRAFGCGFDEVGRRHHRVCTGIRPAALTGIEEAIAMGASRWIEAIGAWSRPGVFSWDRLDPGSALLTHHLPGLAGRGADLGCGIGVLARAVLASPKVSEITLIDVDRRAVEATRRNVEDPRAVFRWGDVRRDGAGLTGLDFVVMNPPFHDGGTEDRSLGQGFIERAAQALRPGGRCWLTANRHLPYEGVLKPLFRTVQPVADAAGYKVISAQK